MSSRERSARLRLLRGEGDLTERGLVTTEWRREVVCGFDRAGLQGTTGLPGQGVVVVLSKAAFSSRKTTLVAKNEVKCSWWDSY